jgi:hypothetical protein
LAGTRKNKEEKRTNVKECRFWGKNVESDDKERMSKNNKEWGGMGKIKWHWKEL